MGQFRQHRELSFEVERVILGNPGLAHTRISVPTGSFDWPEALVPHKIGGFCILVHDRDLLYSVVPSSKGRTRTAVDQIDAIHVLEEEILSALKYEISPKRQIAILLQLAPILCQENISAVIPLIDASDPWVKRAALAALIYATEQSNYIGLGASDIRSFFAEESPLSLDGEPARRFMENYFFLRNRSWKWGSRWNEEEAAKNFRIWKAILSTRKVSSKVAAIIEAPI